MASILRTTVALLLVAGSRLNAQPAVESMESYTTETSSVAFDGLGQTVSDEYNSHWSEQSDADVENMEAVALSPSAMENIDNERLVTPKLYGPKTAILGLLAMLVLLYVSVRNSEENPLASEERGMKKYLDRGKKLGALFAHPFDSTNHLTSVAYMGSIVFALSGLYETISSMRRRSKAAQGQNVPRGPPLRAVTMVHLGLVAIIACLIGIFMTSSMMFFSVGFAVTGLVFASSALVFISALQGVLYQRRRERANASTANKP